jgi:hypothetical protein
MMDWIMEDMTECLELRSDIWLIASLVNCTYTVFEDGLSEIGWKIY